MDFIQQEIYIHKTKLLNLINNLINTQLIDDEISINNEIKTESECLKSILNIKQNNLMNQQINLNNNFNVNPFIIQPNLQMNQPIINMNPIINNDINSFPNDVLINVKFEPASGKKIIIHINSNEKTSELIKRYREKSKDFNNNLFLFNGKKIDVYSSLPLTKYGIGNGSAITVFSTYK